MAACVPAAILIEARAVVNEPGERAPVGRRHDHIGSTRPVGTKGRRRERTFTLLRLVYLGHDLLSLICTSKSHKGVMLSTGTPIDITECTKCNFRPIVQYKCNTPEAEGIKTMTYEQYCSYYRSRSPPGCFNLLITELLENLCLNWFIIIYRPSYVCLWRPSPSNRHDFPVGCLLF